MKFKDRKGKKHKTPWGAWKANLKDAMPELFDTDDPYACMMEGHLYPDEAVIHREPEQKRQQDQREKLPRLKYPHYTTGDAQDWTYEYTWEDVQAFEPAKNPLFHETPDDLQDQVYHKVFPYFIEHPEKLLEGGMFKGKSVNDVLAFLNIHYCFQGPPRTLDNLTIRKHWSEDAVVTDSWDDKKGTAVPEDELLPGELSAVIYEVGCYLVRSAQRVYEGFTDTVAGPEAVRRFKEKLADANSEMPRLTHDEYWMDDWQRVTEISARHVDCPDAPFTYVCKTKHSQGFRFEEWVTAVYAVKEQAAVPDEYASLFVRIDFSGMDNSYDNWYRLSPTGKVTSLRHDAYGFLAEDVRFD